MKMERVHEIVKSINAFGKEKYKKAELLEEEFALQEEYARLAYGKECGALAGKKIWDVERYLKQKNDDLGNVADEELKKFNEDSKEFSNLIKAEISGNRGEAKAFRTLQYIESRNYVLKNVELSDGVLNTELDAVVITPSAITIVEVKNTAKNIFIDETGSYYRTGEFLRLDCNIGGKMKLKEELLKKTLLASGYDGVRINCVVVFTNDKIEVQNKYKGLVTCFASQLSCIVEDNTRGIVYSDGDMDAIRETITVADSKVAYPPKFNVEQYKLDFAMLMAKLDAATAEESLVEESVDKVCPAQKARGKGITAVIKNLIASIYAPCVDKVATGFATSIVSATVTPTTNKGGI